MSGSDATHPPDRGSILTERRNKRTMSLGAMDIRACVEALNRENRDIADSVEAVADAIEGFVGAALERIRAGGRLVYIGAGTSGRLGVLDAAECPPTFQTPPELVVGLIAGGDASLRRSSESKEDERNGALADLDRLELTKRDAILGIAAGGTTPYVLGALEIAAQRGSATGLLVCTPMEAPPFVDHLICVETGPEPLTGSTRMKAGTATKLVLNTISTTLMVQLGKVHENLMVDLRASNSKLRDRAARIVSELTGLTREASFALLEDARGDVKTAILMRLRQVTRDEAVSLLERAGGRLSAALEIPV